MDPESSGDDIYERARAIVGAEMQAITYNEFLPLLLGADALPPYTGYRPEVDPGIGNVFASAAYRLGHSMLSPELLRVDADGSESTEGHLALSDAFFVPQQIIDHGVDSVLRGLAVQRAQAIDAHIIDEVRNLLFGPPGAGGLDLAALNIQRGRDHGLPSYNVVRVAYGLPPADSFGDISPDPDVQAGLDAAYERVDDIDPWIGVLCEPHMGPNLIGETLRHELAEQFAALRDGDRFWYRTYLPPQMVAMVEQQTLARIIRRNTDIGDELADDVFRVGACPGDFNGDGDVGVNDLIAVLDRWGPCAACPEDMNGDQLVDVIDVLQLIQYWGACE